jgi:hypothetical protein
VQTEQNPTNRGARGRFTADYDLNILDPCSKPVLVPAGGPTIDAVTQCVVRIAEQAEPGTELYSVGTKSPVKNVAQAEDPRELHQIDDDMAGFFTPESVCENTLVHRRNLGARQDLVISGYEETMHSLLQQRFVAKEAAPDAQDHIRYDALTAANPVDAFVYLGRYVIRAKCRQ